MHLSRTLHWQLQLVAPVAEVFSLLTTDAGREQFWVERSEQRGDALEFTYPGGECLSARVLELETNARFVMSHFNGSTVSFTLAPRDGGTHLVLEEQGLTEQDWVENRAGWVSVLLALKAHADFGIDLRNHHPRRTWEAGYPDN